MDLLYAVSWYYSGSESKPREFFNKLRAGIAEGKDFPFDCPYQVALVHALRPERFWLVATLVKRGTQGDDSMGTVSKLKGWFDKCGAGDWEDKESKPAHGNTIQAVLGPNYECVETFGTIPS